ncbi:MAG: hypothetical protein JNM57_02945 [Cyclobacteriaceae bacterium]|nr:hypothetical protein [Cyclobacteriaceae bacterium]
MKILQSILLLLFAGLFITSCEDDEKRSNINELSDYARNYLGMQLGGAANRSFASGLNSANPVNGSFQRLFNRSGFSGGRTAGDSTSNPGSGSDTTLIDSPWNWVSCAVITTVQNSDGSTTTTYDYGDGCDEGSDQFKYWVFGKFSSTYRAEQRQQGTRFFDTYYYNSSYDNYGGRYSYDGKEFSWNTDGGSTYSGNSEYDTALHTYKGSYTYSDETTSTWDGVTYAYKGDGKTSYDERHYVIEKNNYEYASGEDFYKTTVLEPLVSNYDCNPYQDSEFIMRCFFITYVSGRERIEYKQGDKTGSFEIYYGNGKCDTIVTIIEDGKQINIDLSKDWYF